MPRMRFPLALAAVPLALAAAGARGDGLPPACGPARDGAQMCMTGQVCRCAYDPAGTLTGRTPGWRWRCDILQSCDADTPAGPDSGAGQAWPGPLYVTPNLNLPGGPGVAPPGAMPPPLPRRP